MTLQITSPQGQIGPPNTTYRGKTHAKPPNSGSGSAKNTLGGHIWRPIANTNRSMCQRPRVSSLAVEETDRRVRSLRRTFWRTGQRTGVVVAELRSRGPHRERGGGAPASGLLWIARSNPLPGCFFRPPGQEGVPPHKRPPEHGRLTVFPKKFRVPRA